MIISREKPQMIRATKANMRSLSKHLIQFVEDVVAEEIGIAMNPSSDYAGLRTKQPWGR